MKKRILSLLLVVIAIFSLTTGCANGDETSATPTSPPATDKPAESADPTDEPPEELEEMTFTTITNSQEVVSNPETDLFSKALKEKFNVNLEIDYIPQGDQAETLVLRMAGDEDPDVMFNNFSQLDEYGVDGYFVPFDDLYDKLPNYRAAWPDDFWAEYMELGAAPDGKHYSLRVPMGNVQLVGQGWLYRMSTIEEFGVEIPDTTDKLYDYLKAIKDKDPDAIPISNRNGMGGITYYFGDSFRTSTNFQWDQDYNDFVYEPVTDKYRDMLVYLNKLYAEGLISKEFSTQADQQWSEHVGAGQVHVLIDYFAREGWADNLTAAIDPDSNWTAVDVFPNGYPDKTPFVTRYSSVGASSARISTRNSEEEIDRLLMIFDWLATEEGAIATQMGEEGVTFEYNEDGEPAFMDHIITPLNPSEGTDTLLKYNLDYRIINLPRYFYHQGGGPSIEIGATVKERDYDYWKHYSLQFDDADQTTIADFGTVVTDKMEEYTVRFIMGQLDPSDDAAWEAYVQDVNKSGLETILPIYQREYAAKYN